MPSDSSDSLLSPGVCAGARASIEQREKPQRPSFSSSVTSDRLRESERWPSTQLKAKAKSFGNGGVSNSPTGARRSVFKEIGLEDTENSNSTSLTALRSSTPSPANASGNDKKVNGKAREEAEQKPWYSKLAKPSRPVIRSAASAPPATFSTFPRVAILAFLIAIVIPGIRYRGKESSNANVPADGVCGGFIGGAEAIENEMVFEKRQESPINICTRWAHQSMLSK